MTTLRTHLFAIFTLWRLPLTCIDGLSDSLTILFHSKALKLSVANKAFLSLTLELAIHDGMRKASCPVSLHLSLQLRLVDTFL